MSKRPNLQGIMARGDRWAMLRPILSTGLSLLNVVVAARILGPANYGIVAIALGVFGFLSWASLLGLNRYLVRQPELPEATPQQVLAFYSTIGLLLCLLLWSVMPLLGVWVREPVVSLLLRCLVPALWLHMVAQVSLAMLERQAQLAEVRLIEAASQIANYLLSILILVIDRSYWGPIAGLGLQFLLLAILARCYCAVPWGWRWQRSQLQSALRYGLTLFGVNGMAMLRRLTVPLLVSRLAGLEATGLISIAIRFTDQLALPRLAIRRTSINIIAKISANLEATRAILGQGITSQTMLVGPPLALFACCAAWLLPRLLGPEWLASAQIFALIAAALLVGTVFDLPAATLQAVGKNSEVTQFHGLYVAILWLVAGLTLPTLGIWGYGIAEVAALLSYGLMHYHLTRLCGSPDYGDGFWGVMAALPPLLLGPWIAPLFSLALLIAGYSLLLYLRPTIRRMLKTLYALVRSQIQLASS